ncbi:hypothetical protein FSY59_16625 [Comamonas sp. Z3]|uniref:hypothetical protein n=1 Tax=Comamonas sp. Z3 TaxID=2601247 RepID=UPI0011E75802|nr:hypothetical protein [Comamonas sp. Z3]TYK69938.1 hypothetical protein FSY59_16625 [Comamonas sp. Z3]
MFRAPYPAHLPHLKYILDDLRYSDAQLARLLDLKPATIKKYRREGQAPRAVHLALFWESRWGISTIDAIAFNHAAGNYALAESLSRTNDRLVKQILTMERSLRGIKPHPQTLQFSKSASN